jgi:hypothetical protein
MRGYNMGISDLPAKFGTDLLIKTVMPGVATSFVFYRPLIYPLNHEFWDSLSFGDTLLLMFLLGLAIGMAFMICDLYIYQLFEGLRFWPDSLWKWKYERMKEKFHLLDDELRDLKEERKSTEPGSTRHRRLSLRIKKISASLREFPPDYGRSSYSGKFPKYPTRFGNVLHEYETYPEIRYGIFINFGNHLSQLLPSETKEELKLKSAIADLCVYLSFSSLLYIFFVPAILFFRKEAWIQVWGHSVPLMSLVCFLVSILAFKALYELSITHHKSYGRFLKSLFDLYRGDLAEKLLGMKKEDINRLYASEEERILWREYQEYFEDYTFLEEEAERE